VDASVPSPTIIKFPPAKMSFVASVVTILGNVALAQLAIQACHSQHCLSILSI
jgi:hypothetical protein